MKTVGLITEYNPFHNGHKYHIEEAKKLTGADTAIVVMSGNFVQRGTPAVMDKFIRAKAAVYGGADLVFELPVCYATASAEYFAEGAVTLLDKIGAVDYICFGSECGDLNSLLAITDILLDEPADFKDRLQKNLRNGMNFAKARADAFAGCYPEYTGIISTPNNILGIEYLKSIKKNKSSIIPCTITRKGNDYHDENCEYELSSATAIRKLINDASLEKAAGYVPEDILRLYKDAINKSFPLTEDDFSHMLYFKLLNDINNNIPLSKYFEVSPWSANRIVNLLPGFRSFSDFAMLLKNKSLTYSRICRGLTHILLGIENADIDAFINNGGVYYARLLAMSDTMNAGRVLKEISASSSLPLITAGGTLKKLMNSDALCNPGKKQLSTDMLADNLYQHVSAIKYAGQPIPELSRGFIKKI